MNIDIRLTGYTSVVFVMNLRPLVRPDLGFTFEKLRGSADYNRFLRTTLPDQMKTSPYFEPLLEDGERERPMSSEEAGFLTGIFRYTMLDTYSAPCYRVRQEELYSNLDPLLVRNHQFHKAYEIFRRWDVFMRPTPMGTFVFRFQRPYRRPTALIDILEDVLDLQRPVDIPSAYSKRRELLEQLGEKAAATDKDVASINRLLDWARVANDQQQRTNYPPLQSLFALEIALQFVSTVGRCFKTDGGAELWFNQHDAEIRPPIHDSYVIHHIDEMSAPRSIVQQLNQVQRRVETVEAGSSGQTTARQSSSRTAPDTYVSLRRQHIRDSVHIRSSLLRLTEGALLRRRVGENELKSYFPDHQSSYIDHILAQDKATWAEELCLLTARVAIIMPSYKSRKDELFISTLPGSDSTSGVSYPSYWEALERMIEFVVEGRLMSQLVERLSTDLLDEFVESLGTARSGMAVGDIQIDHAKFSAPRRRSGEYWPTGRPELRDDEPAPVEPRRIRHRKGESPDRADADRFAAQPRGTQRDEPDQPREPCRRTLSGGSLGEEQQADVLVVAADRLAVLQHHAVFAAVLLGGYRAAQRSAAHQCRRGRCLERDSRARQLRPGTSADSGDSSVHHVCLRPPVFAERAAVVAAPAAAANSRETPPLTRDHWSP
ncbi:MAG: hypothetical protein IPO91_05965 [Chloroflexi bacterium]|nr:hypothetical protein [Chloroflexota bacterium]